MATIFPFHVAELRTEIFRKHHITEKTSYRAFDTIIINLWLGYKCESAIENESHFRKTIKYYIHSIFINR